MSRSGKFCGLSQRGSAAGNAKAMHPELEWWMQVTGRRCSSVVYRPAQAECEAACVRSGDHYLVSAVSARDSVLLLLPVALGVCWTVD
jgi:hypothetical protein